MRVKNKEILVRVHLGPAYLVHYLGKEAYMTRIMEINKHRSLEISAAKVR